MDREIKKPGQVEDELDGWGNTFEDLFEEGHPADQTALDDEPATAVSGNHDDDGPLAEERTAPGLGDATILTVQPETDRLAEDASDRPREASSSFRRASVSRPSRKPSISVPAAGAISAESFSFRPAPTTAPSRYRPRASPSSACTASWRRRSTARPAAVPPSPFLPEARASTGPGCLDSGSSDRKRRPSTSPRPRTRMPI